MTDTAQAAAFFAARLAFQTDVSDVHAALSTGRITLIDARSKEAWDQGHIPGAVHLPHAEIKHALAEITGPVVAHCWGPGCNGATRAALALSEAGYPAQEMIGGIEYWIREGFPVVTSTGEVSRTADELTAIACGC